MDSAPDSTTGEGPVRAAGRRRLLSRVLRKQLAVMMLLAGVSVLVPAGTELWYGYHEALAGIGGTQVAQAQEVASALTGALEGVRRQLGAVTMLPWEVEGWLNSSRRREEYLRLLRIAPH